MSETVLSFPRSLMQLRALLLQGPKGHSPAEWRQLSQTIEAGLAQLEGLLARGQLAQAAAEAERLQRLLRTPPEPSVSLWERLSGRDAPLPNPATQRGVDMPIAETWSPPLGPSRDAGASQVAGRTEVAAAGRAPWNLANRISQLLSFQQQTVVHPEVEWPTQILAGSAFRLFVRAQDHETADTGDAFVVTHRSGTPLDLEVELHLPESGALQLRGPGVGVLRVTDDGRSAALAFELYAGTAGRHALEVTLRYGGVTRTRLGCDIDVAPGPPDVAPLAAQAESSRRQSAELLSSQPFYGLLLQIERASGQAEGAYHVVLSDGAGTEYEGTVLLPGHQAMLNQLFCEITPALKGGSAYQRETQLRNLGSRLAARALPSEIVDALFEPRWDPATALHIECGSLNLPWELLQPRFNSERPFLGSHFAITRYPRLGTPRDVIGRGSCVLVAPADSGLQIAADREALSLLTPPPIIEMNDAEGLLRFLRGNTPCGVLHFACHGDASPGQMFGNKLALERGFLLTSDVVPPPRGQRGAVTGALVFINACRANNNIETLWSDGGWGEAFLAAGAAAVIAPAWSVSDEGAGEVALQLYRGLRDGLTVGEAMRRARSQISSAYILDLLSYAVLGSPHARLAPRTESAL